MEEFYKVGEKWLRTAASTTSTIASTTSAIVATSGARALGMIGSSSGRPEVPARAAAAAVVARQIAALPPHERLSFASTVNGLPSVYSTRISGKPPEELEGAFYEEGFDPVRHMLEHLPQESSEMNQEHFDMKVGRRLLQLDAITERLSKQVMENREEMVKGMQLVTELDKDLQLTNIICKNGRRFLSMAAQEVTQDLLVAANVRRKQVLLEPLPVLDRLQLAIETKSRLDGIVEAGNYALAFEACLECALLLEDLTDLKAVMEVNHDLEEWLQRTIDKVDKVLLAACYKFDPEKYRTVVLAYVVLDDVSSLVEKAQTFFSQIVVSETHAVIRSLLFKAEDPHGLPQMSRIPYNDLCSQLSEAKFRECLQRSLEVLFNVLAAYYQMMTWRPLLAVEEPPTTSGLYCSSVPIEKHRRTGSHGDLLPTAQDSKHVRTGSLHGISSHDLQGGLITGSNHSLVRGGSGRLRVGKVDTLISDGPAPADMEPVSVGEGNHHRATLCVEGGMFAVARALERGRKTVWELCARRIAVLLSCDALFMTTPHHFLQSLDRVNKFILAGEAFSGGEALILRAKLLKQSERYFWTFHRQNLEVLRMILEKELWQKLSSPSLNLLSLAVLLNRAPIHGPPHLRGESDVGGTQREVIGVGLSMTKEKLSSRAGFDDWLGNGNPFAEKKAHKSFSVETSENALPSSRMGDDHHVAPNLENVGDEEGEDEDLLADFIDEESQLPGRLLSDFKLNPARIAQLHELEGSLILTSSAVSLLRYMDKYVKLMQILQPIVSEVFRGLCQLFELYFFTIFKVFGNRDFLSASLRSTLMRISQGLEEQRVQLPTSTSLPTSLPTGSPPGPLISSASSHLSTEQSPHSMGSALPMIPSNLYALKERTVAIDSLVCLSKILEKTYLDFKMTLPQDILAYMEHFFSQTVELLPELRIHIFKVVARLLLNIGGYVDRISNGRWELKELGLEHNGYVDLLLGEYKQYTNKISQGSIPKEVQEAMLEYGVDILAETILEGLSRVKRCNNEGRALMSLDLQVLINGLHHLAPSKLKANLNIVETYIKAFYLPETEYLHWIRAHPEYTKGQVIGLINLVASTCNWKRKTKMDLLDKIETGDL